MVTKMVLMSEIPMVTWTDSTKVTKMVITMVTTKEIGTVT